MKEPEDKGTQGSGAPNEPPSSEPTDSLVPPPTGPADSTKPEPGEPMDPLASPAERPADPAYAATMLPPEEPPEESPSRMWWWIVGIAAVALVLGLVFGLNRCGTVEVPNLEGMTVAEASAELADAGLTLGVVTASSEETPDAEEGTIIAQDPSAGDEVDEGSAVGIVVAGEPGDQPPAIVEVPNVVGLSASNAKTTVEQAGLPARMREVYDDKVQKDIVISQDPTGGTSVEAGTDVTITVSLGKNPAVEVPGVVGETEQAARAALVNAGFEPVPAWAYSETVQAGLVISQNPAQGVSAPRGSPVSFTISLGAEPPSTATVPDVIGKQESEANSLMEAAGYTVLSVREYSVTVPEDAVGYQIPAGGSVTEPGIEVGIIVADGPRPPEFILVPDVSEMSLDDATELLEDAGLQVLSYEVFTDLGPAGQVLAQLPAAGSSVAPASYVLVIVSKGEAPGTT